MPLFGLEPAPNDTGRAAALKPAGGDPEKTLLSVATMQRAAPLP